VIAKNEDGDLKAKTQIELEKNMKDKSRLQSSYKMKSVIVNAEVVDLER
jgi:hypothetical protein